MQFKIRQMRMSRIQNKSSQVKTSNITKREVFETLEYEIKLFSLLSFSFYFHHPSYPLQLQCQTSIGMLAVFFILFCSLHITTYFNLTIFKSYITFNYGIINGGVCAENQLNFNHLFNKKKKKTDSKRILYNKLCMNLKYN